RTLLDATTRARLGANARRAVLPLSPAATTLQLVLLYRDLLAATVQAKAAARGNRTAQAATDAPSTTRSAETRRPAGAPDDATAASPEGVAAAKTSPPLADAASVPLARPATSATTGGPTSPPATPAADEIPPG